jgi:ribosomal protein S18 acetylase RimI-like enzyme
VPLTFRFATPSAQEIEAIVGLVESAYRGPSSRAGWTTEADLLEGQRTDAGAVAGIIAGDHGGILLAEADCRLVGCCQLQRRPDGTAYFGMFAVVPRQQGQGLGRLIVAEAERIAGEEWGGDRMSMTVIRQRADLIAWYERLGYRTTGRTEPFPYGDERFGIPTRPDLEFLVLEKSLVPSRGAPGATADG